MILTLDFETYFDSSYSLRNIPIHQYVMDARFHVHGAGLRLDDYDPRADTPVLRDTRWLEGKELEDFLFSLEWGGITLVGHNLGFDGFILTHHYKVFPAKYHCTLAMSRPMFGVNNLVNLDSVGRIVGFPPKKVDIMKMSGVRFPDEEQKKQLAERAIGDVDRTYKIYNLLYSHYPAAELQLIDNTIKMYVEPCFVLDKKLVTEVQEKNAEEREAAIKASGLSRTVLGSDAKLANTLKNKGIEVPTKFSEAQEKYVPAFAKDDIEFKKWTEDEELAKYYHARVAAKTTQIESKTKRLLAVQTPRLPIYLNYCGAHTFRWSGGDKMNAQNFGRGSPLRRALTAPPGYVIGVWDSAQIEARMNAWLAGQTDVLKVFADGGDPYRMMAARIWGKDLEDVTPGERFVGKVCVLALGYQMGAARFQDTLAKGLMGAPVFMEIEECDKIKSIYRSANNKIVEQWWYFNDMIPKLADPNTNDFKYKCVEFCYGGLFMPNELVMRYPNVRQREYEIKNEEGEVIDTRIGWFYETVDMKGRKVWSKLYGGLFVENTIQSLSRIVIGDHINKISEELKVGLTVHDEIAALLPEDKADYWWQWGKEICETPPAWCEDLPLLAEGGWDKVYSK